MMLRLLASAMGSTNLPFVEVERIGFAELEIEFDLTGVRFEMVFFACK